jgi:hypothetical protein
MTKKERIDVTVLVAETHWENMAEVARTLKGKGFVLKESLAEIGVLTGSVPATSLNTLATVPGVTTVEEQRTDYRPQS